MSRNARTKRKGCGGDDSEPVFLRFTFDGFESLPHVNGTANLSEVKDDGRGNSWQIQLYPGGEDEESSECLSMFLFMTAPGGGTVDTQSSLSIRNASGGMHSHVQLGNHQYVGGGDGVGKKAMEKRSTILEETNNILSNGALVIDVEILIIGKKRKYEPSNPAFANMRNLFGSDRHADVWFKLGETLVPAHKLILQMNAPILAEFCGEEASPVLINDTSLDVFRIVLRYVYGKNIPAKWIASVVSKGKDIIEAADRFDVVGLKMAVEKILVEQQVINLTNVAGWIVFADSKTCALIKEHAQAYFAKRVKDVLALESSSELKESPKLLTELLLASSTALHDDCVSVDELREKLEKKGLDVDGSKEALVLRLGAAED